MTTKLIPETEMERLSREDPAALLAYVRTGDLPPYNLTFALEHLGNVRGVDVTEALVANLTHESPSVREGALYGLTNRYPCEDADTIPPYAVRLAVDRLARDDPSATIREIAREDADDWTSKVDDAEITGTRDPDTGEA